jgi:hypothetical protein
LRPEDALLGLLHLERGRIVADYLKYTVRTAVLFGLLFIVSDSFSQSADKGGLQFAEENESIFTIPSLENPVHLDGIMDDSEWGFGPKIRLPFEVDPGNNSSAPVDTFCRIAFDDAYLYFGCVASDPNPELIRVFITDRDGLDGHDKIVLFLDPFDDSRRAMTFGVNPLGVQQDGTIDEQRSDYFDSSWDGIWDSFGRITERGFVIEAAVPFKTLRFPNTSDPQSWRFFIERTWPRSAEVTTRTGPIVRSNPCVLCQASHVNGVIATNAGINLELRPTLTSGRTDERDDNLSSGLTAGDLRREFGLDLRWNPTSDITLSGTLNPDFSQVEADAAQLDINNNSPFDSTKSARSFWRMLISSKLLTTSFSLERSTILRGESM